MLHENGRLKSTTRDGLADVPVETGLAAPTWHLASSVEQSCDAVVCRSRKTCNSDALSFNTIRGWEDHDELAAAAKAAGISCAIMVGKSFGGTGPTINDMDGRLIRQTCIAIKGTIQHASVRWRSWVGPPPLPVL